MYVYVCVYVYMYMCVCVCVCKTCYALERAPRGIRGDAAPLRATPHANNNATPIFAALIPTYSPLISRLC